MDEKTEELRDIFMDVADEETVTESQADTHGSLGSEADVDERLRDAVEEMRENLDVDTDFATEDLVTLVKVFYTGGSDDAIAATLDADVDDVADARFDLHLLRDADTDAPFDLADLRERRDAADVGEDADAARDAPDPASIADDLDAGTETVERCLRVLDTRDEIRRVNDRYRAEFENALRDRELSERLTATVHEDGLDDATEGQETDMNI